MKLGGGPLSCGAITGGYCLFGPRVDGEPWGTGEPDGGVSLVPAKKRVLLTITQSIVLYALYNITTCISSQVQNDFCAAIHVMDF